MEILVPQRRSSRTYHFRILHLYNLHTQKKNFDFFKIHINTYKARETSSILIGYRPYLIEKKVEREKDKHL